MHIRDTFGEAKSLAGTLADSEGVKYGVIAAGEGYMIVDGHSVWFKTAERIDSELLVTVVYPGNDNEDIFRRALEQIAYPENWPKDREQTWDLSHVNQLRLWMQSTAADALTNGRSV